MKVLIKPPLQFGERESPPILIGNILIHTLKHTKMDNVTLIILATLTVNAFKVKVGTEELHVIKNPKNSKLFITTDSGNVVGAVSKNYTTGKPKEFIQCKWSNMLATAEPIWVLHNINADNRVESF